MSLDRRSVVLEKAVSALKKGSLTFSFASEFLGRSSKESAALFYHWCREVDDSIDDVEEPAKSLFLKAAQLSLMQFKQNQKLEILSAGWASLEILLQTHPRLIIFCQDLLRGMEMDLQNVDITDEANLDDYCYCVAGSVGAAMCVINGIEDEKTLESAIAYGKALQCYNIARDIYADCLLQRDYIPAPWRNHQRIKTQDFEDQTDFLTRLQRRMVEKGNVYFAEGKPGLHRLPLILAIPFAVAGFVYSGIGEKILKKKTPAQRVFLSFFEKLKWMFRGFFYLLEMDMKGLASFGVIASLLIGTITFSFVSNLSMAWALLLVPWTAFLFTGLFIVSHDAIHGTLMPHFPTLNLRVGQIALFGYAGFSFRDLEAKHHQHHDHVATLKDPDFHNGKNESFWPWYFHFMWTYRSFKPFLFFQVSFVIMFFGFGVSLTDFMVYWAVPAILSSLQLFYFGTYLTHKKPVGDYNFYRATSNDFPGWLSLMTCYHFGYHLEHHASPQTPWWGLPALRKKMIAASVNQTLESPSERSAHA